MRRAFSTLSLAAALAAALTMSACASRRAPPPTAADTPPPLAETQPGTQPGGATPGGTAPGGPGEFGAGGGMAGVPASGPGSLQDFVVNAGDRVYFDTDSYSIREDAAPVLAAQAQWLQRYPNVRVIVEGNADERGTREYNLGLGARRAVAVRDFLISRGLAPFVQDARTLTIAP